MESRPRADQRWMRAGVFEAMAHDLRVALEDRAGQPTAVIIDSRTVQSTPESGARAGYDGHQRRKGSKVPIAVDTLGCLLALKVTAANEQERAQVAQLARQLQTVTRQNVAVAFVDQGYTGAEAAAAATQEGLRLEVVKLQEAKHAASCSCRVVGWSNVPLLGAHASAASPATTNDLPPASPAFTG